MRSYQNIIIFGNAKWQDNFAGNSAQQLAMAFIKKGFKVIYLAPGNDQPKIAGSLYYASIDKRSPIPSLAKLIDEFHCNSNNSLYICNLASLLSLNILDFFLENSFKIIYRHVDNFEEIKDTSGYSENSAKRHCQSADLVSVSHPELVNSLPAQPKKLILLQNGVDSHLFAFVDKSDTPPKDIKLGKLTLGFWGSYWGERIDWELLSFLASRNSTWAINLIASTEYLNIDQKTLAPNINLIEAKTPKELCDYRNFFDVCLIPYRNEQSFARYSNPIKALEYLAGYKPVVSPANQSLQNYPYTFFYKSKNEIEQKILEASSSKIDCNQVDLFLQENTWTARAESLLSNLD